MNILRIRVENPDELLNASAFGAAAKVRVESSSDNVSFAEIATSVILSGTTLYTIYDSAGTLATYYRTRYSNSGGNSFSEYSPVFQVDSSPVEYVNLATLKARLGKSTGTEDQILSTVCTQVNAWIESQTGRPIGPDPSASYTIDGADVLEYGRCILFPRGIRSVSQLQVAAYTGAALQTIPSTDYFLRPTASERMPGWPATELWMTNVPSSNNPLPYFSPGFNTIVITGSFGWASIPWDLQEAAEILATRAYLWRQAGHQDMGGGDVGSWLADPANMPYRHKMTIQQYAWKPVPVV